ncbi:hypothetical protein NLU13_4867 [Sarocladium strictum]|uniref:Cut9 interacting protein Scn1 n=1 Tax=Sarocladium strictum TaxID=5046 RepID=A0AA39L9B3_SARSR|nr:hypothetical protein NLU13_4867 [Sarocladium strictum]
MCQQHQDGNPNPPLQSSSSSKDPFPWHLPIYDAHCHPTDTMSSVPFIASHLRASALTIMATRSQDQHLVAEVASDLGVINSKQDLVQTTSNGGGGRKCKIIPAFGWHPWFSHQIQDDTTAKIDSKTSTEENKSSHYRSVLTPIPDDNFIASLPHPLPLSTLLSQFTENLTSHPRALVGEVGLDKAFRLPSAPSTSDARDESLTPGGREGRVLSPYRVKPEHQRRILEAQLRLAGEHRRAVSVHGVQAHGLLLETASKCWKGHERKIVSRRKRRLVAEGAESSSDSDSDDDGDETASSKPLPYPPRLCLHSFSGPPELVRQWLNPSIPATIFFSFSTAVNAASESAREKLKAVVKEIPDGKLLVESDLHVAGEDMETSLEDMYRFICDVKGWDLEDGVRTIAKNYEDFVFGAKQ